MNRAQKKKLISVIISSVLLAGAYVLNKCFSFPAPIVAVSYLIPYAVAGLGVIIKCFNDIKSGEIFGENMLMTVATFGAIAIGEYPEAVFVMIFNEIGSLFESIAVGKSRDSIAHLSEIIPENANVIRNGETVTVPADEVEIGDSVSVRAGERFPVDGVVISGNCNVDTSAITGESLPVPVFEGKEVTSGFVALDGAVCMRAERTAETSAVSKIVEMIENASSSKAKSEKFITSFSRIYTPAVVAAAFATAVIPTFFGGDFATWLHRALIFLVISCPCALVISVPLSYFGGIGAAAKKGILAKGSDALEALAKAENFVFDKTGTLTESNFAVKKISAFEIEESELVFLAASAENNSSHPLAKSLVDYCKSVSSKPLAPCENVKEFSGLGIEACVLGKNVAVGSEKLMENLSVEIPENTADASVFICIDGKFVGSVSFTDIIKKNSASAVKQLKESGINVYMLSGDKKAAVSECATELSVDNFKYRMLPQDKAAEIEKIKKSGTTVFIGDGINDAPCLAASDIGIAMGGIGSDIAIDCADMVLTDDDPKKAYDALMISKKVHKIVIENIVFALSVKVAVILLSAFGVAMMWEAVIADVGVSVVAIINSLRLTKSK